MISRCVSYTSIELLILNCYFLLCILSIYFDVSTRANNMSAKIIKQLENKTNLRHYKKNRITFLNWLYVNEGFHGLSRYHATFRAVTPS